MHKFRADTVNNRFYMHMEGFYNEDEMRRAANESILEADKLSPGFTIINNSADLHIHDMGGLQYVGKMMEFAKNNGAKLIIRVVKDKLAQLQLKDLTRKVHDGIEVVEVSSLEQAEEYIKEHDL